MYPASWRYDDAKIYAHTSSHDIAGFEEDVNLCQQDNGSAAPSQMRL
jgi:hypothetical protein